MRSQYVIFFGSFRSNLFCIVEYSAKPEVHRTRKENAYSRTQIRMTQKPPRSIQKLLFLQSMSPGGIFSTLLLHIWKTISSKLFCVYILENCVLRFNRLSCRQGRRETTLHILICFILRRKSAPKFTTGEHTTWASTPTPTPRNRNEPQVFHLYAPFVST